MLNENGGSRFQEYVLSPVMKQQADKLSTSTSDDPDDDTEFFPSKGEGKIPWSTLIGESEIVSLSDRFWYLTRHLWLLLR